MPRKCVAMPTIDIVQTHWKPETKKTGDGSNQWRSKVKCRPGPTIKLPSFQPHTFAYKNCK